MPSLRHTVVARAIPRLRRSTEAHDPDAVRREQLAEQAAADTAPPRWVRKRLEVTSLDGFGFPVHDLRPPAGQATRTILYVHGGGYTAHAEKVHWRWVTLLAEHLKARVVFPVYPLAPTYSWRDSHPQMLRLFEQVAIDSPRGVTLMGDSAGGGYALALAQQLRARPGPQPTRLVLISPWVDATASSTGTDQASAEDPWLRMTRLRTFGEWWAGSDDPRRPEVSPLYGDLSGLPPTLMFCGTRDTLSAQCRDLAGRARAARWPLRYVEEPGLLHVYPLLPVPEARKAFDQTVAFLEEEW